MFCQLCQIKHLWVWSQPGWRLGRSEAFDCCIRAAKRWSGAVRCRFCYPSRLSVVWCCCFLCYSLTRFDCKLVINFYLLWCLKASSSFLCIPRKLLVVNCLWQAVTQEILKCLRFIGMPGWGEFWIWESVLQHGVPVAEKTALAA